MGLQTGITFLSKTVLIAEQKSSTLSGPSAGQNPVNNPFSVAHVIAFGIHILGSPFRLPMQAKPAGQLLSHSSAISPIHILIVAVSWVSISLHPNYTDNSAPVSSSYT